MSEIIIYRLPSNKRDGGQEILTIEKYDNKDTYRFINNQIPHRNSIASLTTHSSTPLSEKAFTVLSMESLYEDAVILHLRSLRLDLERIYIWV